jgi:uncharacterized membrane protein YuzA (DUF378 family)
MKMLNFLTLLLVVVGGLNWGLVGLVNLNLVTALLGEGSMLSTLTYVLVGASALYVAAMMLPKEMK